jgi:hypothetical protein
VAYSRKGDSEHSGSLTHSVYVLYKISARSRYRYCNGNAKPSMCIVEIHVTVSCVSILDVVKHCFYDRSNVLRS